MTNIPKQTFAPIWSISLCRHLLQYDQCPNADICSNMTNVLTQTFSPIWPLLTNVPTQTFAQIWPMPLRINMLQYDYCPYKPTFCFITCRPHACLNLFLKFDFKRKYLSGLSGGGGLSFIFYVFGFDLSQAYIRSLYGVCSGSGKHVLAKYTKKNNNNNLRYLPNQQLLWTILVVEGKLHKNLLT